ncbi:uncharacterized protein METZ01_LOCUS244052, partial [marine metagenome]
PPELPNRHVGLFYKAQNICIKLEGLFLVGDEHTA